MFSNAIAGGKLSAGQIHTSAGNAYKESDNAMCARVSAFEVAYADHGVRLMWSLCLAIMLHCVTAAAHGAGVMC